jgi:acyl carrier protein
MAEDVSQTIAELISRCSGGTLSAADVLARRDDLGSLGLSSLAQLKLLDLIEGEFDVFLGGEEDMSFLNSLAGIEGHVRAELENAG